MTLKVVIQIIYINFCIFESFIIIDINMCHLPKLMLTFETFNINDVIICHNFYN